jgi:hypothetical protein
MPNDKLKIACLGWGSLIWDRGDLPVLTPWFPDGPLLPIEFARQSLGNRITLVIVPKFPFVHTLWALLSVENLDEAKVQLAKREGISIGNIRWSIGYWAKKESSTSRYAKNIGKWAVKMDLDAVVWTALKPKFQEEKGRIPTADELIAFLQNLPPDQQKAAEHYVRMAPAQVNTAYRRRMEKDLGWTPIT